MNKGAATNIIAVVAVVVVIAGAAWLRSQRAETAVGEASLAAEPVQTVTTEQTEPVNAEAPTTPEPIAEVKEAPADVVPGAEEPPDQPATAAALPRLVDLGADKCIPCKKLAPILEELRKEYQGKLSVEFIDVWKNPTAGEPYGIRLIPTQILYDREGNEVWRHEGFISKEDLKTIFAEKVGVG